MKKCNANQSGLRQAIERKISTSDRKKAIRKLSFVLATVKPGFDSTRAIRENREND